MDNGYEVLSNNISSCNVMITDVSECFICRDGEQLARDPLRKFCDCKSLLAHHLCLSTWIKKGFGSEDRLKCSICNAEFHLQRHSPWRALVCWWQTWLLLAIAGVVLGLVPYVVYCMMTAFSDPPPHITFKMAAVCFGLLTETLLIKCVSSYLCRQYRQAELSSFTVLARASEEGQATEGSLAPWCLAAGSSAATVSSQAEERKQESIKAGCVGLILKL